MSLVINYLPPSMMKHHTTIIPTLLTSRVITRHLKPILVTSQKTWPHIVLTLTSISTTTPATPRAIPHSPLFKHLSRPRTTTHQKSNQRMILNSSTKVRSCVEKANEVSFNLKKTVKKCFRTNLCLAYLNSKEIIPHRKTKSLELWKSSKLINFK